MIKYHDAIVIVFLIGYHIFRTLLPGCYYEMILLDAYSPNHHILEDPSLIGCLFLVTSLG